MYNCVLPLETLGFINISIDGADEFTENLNLIKGGGGALFREKIVASLSKTAIIVTDSSKKVKKLGAFTVPVEVVPLALQYVLNEISKLKGKSTLRKKDGKTFISDNDNYIVDVDFGLISEISEEFDLIGYYVFSTDTESKGSDATSRMFGPRYGILEESGTGMAAGPLACYLYDVLKKKKESFYIQQGEYMAAPSPSLIVVDLLIKNGEIKSLMAGGMGMLKSKLEIEIAM